MLGNCSDVVKVFFIGLNAAVLFLSIAIVGLGIWALTSEYGADQLAAIISTDLYTAGCAIIITAGVVIFLMSFLGVLGALLDTKLFLVVYVCLMTIFLLMTMIGAIVGFFLLDEIEDSLANDMKDTLINKYHVDIPANSENNDITEIWDTFQKDLKCCGVRGTLNSTESWFLWQSSQWFQTEGQASANTLVHKYVPSSCCNADAGVFDDCQKLNSGNDQPPKQSLAAVVTENPALYHEGCLDALQDKINDHVVAIIVTAIVLLVVLVVCCLLAMYMLCRVVGQQGKIRDNEQQQQQQQNADNESIPAKESDTSQSQEVTKSQQQVVSQDQSQKVTKDHNSQKQESQVVTKDHNSQKQESQVVTKDQNSQKKESQVVTKDQNSQKQESQEQSIK